MYSILKHINNFFPTSIRESGRFEVKDGSLNLPSLISGRYFIIEGSNFNDKKVWKAPTCEMIDEVFDGYVTVIAPPEEFLELVTEIKAYKENTERNDLASESFGGYSYTRKTNRNGDIADWHDVFRQRLNEWRKL